MGSPHFKVTKHLKTKKSWSWTSSILKQDNRAGEHSPKINIEIIKDYVEMEIFWYFLLSYITNLCRFCRVLTMVYSTQNYWGFWLCPASILETIKHNISEGGSVSILSLGEETPTGSLRKS
jgi:hypothetical protein